MTKVKTHEDHFRLVVPNLKTHWGIALKNVEKISKKSFLFLYLEGLVAGLGEGGALEVVLTAVFVRHVVAEG